jgi:16S rRNA (guanine966-N2)-methyltransferase
MARNRRPNDKLASGRGQPPENETSPKNPRRPIDQSVVGLRIIGGSLRGRKIEYSGDVRTRPMKDRVREAVFNLLGQGVVGTQAIDLFAGTGAMALEAISRGAKSAICIERHYPTAKLIEKTARDIGIADRITVAFGDAFHWSKEYAPTPNSVPLTVFCSPPYDFFVERNAEMLDLIARWMQLASPGSLIVIEADERFDFTRLPASEAWDVRTYPPAIVGIWEKPADG